MNNGIKVGGLVCKVYDGLMQYLPHRRKYKVLTSLLIISLMTPLTSSAEISGRSIVASVEDILWGKTVQGEYEMKITTPHWERTLKMNVWMRRPEKSFIRILSPAKEKGIGSLRINNEMWNYLPKVERTLKVPPSMMLQPWMGSDFSNDDLVKESSVVDDYKHNMNITEQFNNQTIYRIESIPKPDAAVVWGKLVYMVRTSDLMPLRLDYFDERDRLIKTLTFSRIEKLDNRLIPTVWKMQSTAKPENSTTVKIIKAKFNQDIPEKIFTLRNLRKNR